MRWFGVRGFAVGLLCVLAAAVVSRGEDEQQIALGDCPKSVRKTLEAEAKGAPIDGVTRETGDDGTVFWATVVFSGRHYAIGVAEDGTLNEVTLEADDEEVPFAKCPAAVQTTFRHESKDAKIETVDKDVKHGTVVYQAAVAIGGRDYLLVVAQDGTLVEKTLVVEEDDVALTDCPAATQKTLHAEARGGSIGAITRSTGIVGHVYEAEVTLGAKLYVVEVAENGMLISKWISGPAD